MLFGDTKSSSLFADINAETHIIYLKILSELSPYWLAVDTNLFNKVLRYLKLSLILAISL